MKKESTKPQSAVVKKLQQELVEMENRYKRILADYQNLEKRQESQTAAMARYSAESILDSLIPVLENLDRAQSHLKDQGLEMVTKQFKETLKNEGLEAIQSDGTDFDPQTMDCVEKVAGKKDKVVTTISRGWRLYDKVLRHAKVTVGKD